MSAARDQMYWDLFVTALEGGIGYWSQCAGYHIWLDADAGTEDLMGFYADILDVEAKGEPCYVIDRDTIARGYRLATLTHRDSIAWSSGDKPPYAITNDTEWDFDASDADVIVQLGLFREVIYG